MMRSRMSRLHAKQHKVITRVAYIFSRPKLRRSVSVPARSPGLGCRRNQIRCLTRLGRAPSWTRLARGGRSFGSPPPRGRNRASAGSGPLAWDKTGPPRRDRGVPRGSLCVCVISTASAHLASEGCACDCACVCACTGAFVRNHPHVFFSHTADRAHAEKSALQSAVRSLSPAGTRPPWHNHNT